MPLGSGCLHRSCPYSPHLIILSTAIFNIFSNQDAKIIRFLTVNTVHTPHCEKRLTSPSWTQLHTWALLFIRVYYLVIIINVPWWHTTFQGSSYNANQFSTPVRQPVYTAWHPKKITRKIWKCDPCALRWYRRVKKCTLGDQDSTPY